MRLEFPIFRALQEEIRGRLKEWARGGGEDGKLDYLLHEIVPVWLGVTERNNHYHPFAPRLQAHAKAEDYALYRRHHYIPLLAAANITADRLAIALRYGATPDDIVHCVKVHTGQPVDEYTKEHGKEEVVLNVPLGELLFG